MKNSGNGENKVFIEPDEHIIVMEDDINYPWSVDDLKKIEDAGIKTILVPHKKSIDWYLYGRFKIIAPFFYQSNIPMNYKNLVDYINDKKTIEMFARMVVQSNPINVQRIYAIPEGGEFLWDSMLTNKFPISDDQLIDFVISIQRLLVRQYNEIWLCLHNFLGHHNNWNNTRLPYLYQALRDEFPDTPFYSLQFAHFSCGGTSTSLEQQYKVKEYKDRFGIRFFVGSDYCEGLTKNFDEAMKQEVYGFVTSPMHQENPIKHTQVEDWMVKELQDTNRKINDYHKI
jgi:hypothetical protein